MEGGRVKDGGKRRRKSLGVTNLCVCILACALGGSATCLCETRPVYFFPLFLGGCAKSLFLRHIPSDFLFLVLFLFVLS